METINEQKKNTEVAIRKMETQKKREVYYYSSSFFRMIKADEGIEEMQSRMLIIIVLVYGIVKQNLEKTIANYAEERDTIIKKLHQMGIYGL